MKYQPQNNHFYLNKKKQTLITVIAVIIGAVGTVTNGFVKGQENLELRGRKDYPEDRIIKIGPNTEKSPGELWRLVITKTPPRNHRLKLV